MADLSKFGVPMPDGQRLGMLHPKQNYRFRVVFENFGTNRGLRELTSQVVSVTRPTFTDPRIAVHSYNSVSFIRGKHEWNEITLTARDDLTNAVVSSVGAQVQRQFNHFEQTSATAGINYKFKTSIHVLDGVNEGAIEIWELDGCFLTEVNYGEHNYESGDPLVISMNISFDNATQIEGPNNNGGTTIGGDPFIDIVSPSGGTTQQ